MMRSRWISRHRVLAAFLGGVLLTLVAVAAVGYWVLSDQRRSARALARALSQALAREVRIERVTDIGTERVVMRGVELPREGGWPATVVAERVEATGPLLAAARGDPAPVRVTVTRPAVEIPAGGGAGLAALEGLAESVRSVLSNPLVLDLRLTGGKATHAGGVTEFDLGLLKERGAARGELTLREGPAPPLTLSLEARQDGEAARLTLAAGGGLAPLARSLPGGAAAALAGRTLELRLEVDLGAGGSVVARGRAAVGDALVAAGSATFKGGVLEVALSQATVDLGFGAGFAGLGWTPSGRAELGDATATWRVGAGAWPTLRATVRVPALTVPAAGAGAEVMAERLETRLQLQPAGAGLGVSGEARAGRLRVAGLELAPAETRYRVGLDARGSVVRADLDALRARMEGAALEGTLGYGGAAGRLEARLEGQEVEAAGLVRRLAPGWLVATDRLRLVGARLTASGLDPRDLRRGTARLDATGLRLERADGRLAGGALSARAELGRDGIVLAVDAERLASTLPMLTGELPRVSASATLARRPDASLHPERGALTARDREGRELVVANLEPAPTDGRLRVIVRAPALERLDGLWPAVPRRLSGSARLDVELVASDLATGEGRLTLGIPDGELWHGKVAIRDLTADVPVRRGAEGSGEPPWGALGIGELIAYGVVVRDLATPARVWRDRLSLNDLTYVLYSGNGKGWSEIDLQAAGLSARGKLTGSRVRIEEFMAAYGVRGGTMTGLMRYELDYQYRAGRLGLNGRFEVPEGGTVNIELLNRVLGYAESDPTGVVRRALENLRAFDYKHAEAEVRSAGDDVRVSLSLQGRERFLLFPPRVREINVRNMPLSFLARQFPGS